MRKLKQIEKDIFKTVCQWGRVGIVTDEKCNTFQSLMTEYAQAVKSKEIILTPEQAKQISNILSGNNNVKDLKEKIDDELLKL